MAHLHAIDSAPASIVSIISAVTYFHKNSGFPDPTNNYIVGRLLAGARNLGSVTDIRLPVTLPILIRLVQAIPTVFCSHYRRLTLRAMMVLAFRVYLRVGEIVPRSRSTMQGCLQLGAVFITSDLIIVSLHHFKHSASQGPQCLQVRGDCLQESLIYPAAFLREFIQALGPLPGTLFAYSDGRPMLRYTFCASLKQLLNFCGYKSTSFKGHSFHIGAATATALRVSRTNQSGRQVDFGCIPEIY